MNAMKKLATIPSLVALAVALAFGSSPALAVPVTLGSTLSTFAVLGGTSVTNAAVVVPGPPIVGKTIINGRLGACLSDGSDLDGCTGVASITGFDDNGFATSTVNGTIHRGDVTAALAAVQLKTAYNLNPAVADVLVANQVGLGGLSGTTKTAGVYAVASTDFDLAAGTTLILDGNDNVAEQWVFLMSAALHAGVGSKVDVSQLGAGDSVYWIVRSSAFLHEDAEFAGNILALTSITFHTGATDRCGGAYAQNGLVSFAGKGTVTNIANEVGGGCPLSGDLTGEITAQVPEPEIYAMMGMGLGLMGWVARRRKQKAA